VNAREYYYTVLAPDEAGLSYAALHLEADGRHSTYYEEHERPTEEQWAAIFRHVPEHSNDALLEDVFKKIVDRSPVRLRPRLNNMFIAKKRDFRPIAGAYYFNDSYEGELIRFNVGLSDACLQYSTLFADFLNLLRAQARRSNGEPVPEFSRLSERVARHAGQLAELQVRWSKIAGVVALDENYLPTSPDSLEYAIKTAVLTDYFILAHEIAHHLLAHTGAENSAGEMLANIPEWAQDWIRVKTSHAVEFQADALAVLLLTGSGSQREKSDIVFEQRVWEAAIGSMLALTVIGQFADDAENDTDTHPSIRSRFSAVGRVLASLNAHAFRDAVEDILPFQQLLFRFQRRGIGSWDAQFTQSLTNSKR
jgi:hypothetical protein